MRFRNTYKKKRMIKNRRTKRKHHSKKRNSRRKHNYGGTYGNRTHPVLHPHKVHNTHPLSAQQTTNIQVKELEDMKFPKDDPYMPQTTYDKELNKLVNKFTKTSFNPRKEPDYRTAREKNAQHAKAVKENLNWSRNVINKSNKLEKIKGELNELIQQSAEKLNARQATLNGLNVLAHRADKLNVEEFKKQNPMINNDWFA